jgi:glutamyl-tRNA synthetase
VTANQFIQLPQGLAPAGRFAPTPSGRLHLGNLFAALLAWLSARHDGLRFVLRIEDLDVQANKAEFIPIIESDLAWLGIDWDEGGLAGGVCAPYLQHERFDLYAQAFDALERQGLVYPCFCSRADLHAASAPHASDGRVVYPGTCKYLTTDQIASKRLSKPPAWRLSVAKETISFTDLHYGTYSEDIAAECGDYIIRRADGLFGYQLAVVVDDALMGVTQIVRGRDLLGFTPPQIYLQRLLGLPEPEYAHTPMLMAPDGRRLAKRNRDADAGELRAKYAPEEVVGRLAHACGLRDTPAPIAAAELVDGFSWDAVTREDIVVDEHFFE